MAIEYNFTLDMDRSKRDNNIAYARTGDVDSITINADLVFNGAAYTPTGTNAFFECITPNGCSIRTAASKTGSAVSVDVPSAAFQAAGVINVAYFRFETGDASNPTYVESTEPFAIVVREGIGDNIDAGDYIEEWRKLANQLEATVAEVEQKAKQAETAINEQKTEVDQLKAQAQTAIAGDVTEVETAAQSAINAINQEKTDVAEAAEGVTAAGDQAISQFKTNSQQAVDKFKEDSQQAVDTFNTNGTSAIDQFNTNGTSAIDQFNTDADSKLGEVDDMITGAQGDVDAAITQLENETNNAIKVAQDALDGTTAANLQNAINRTLKLDVADMTNIPDNSSLSSFTNVGSYCCKTAATAATVGDCPVDDSPFNMYVFSSATSGQVMQLVIPIDLNGKPTAEWHVRFGTSSAMDPWSVIGGGADIAAGLGIDVTGDAQKTVALDTDAFYQHYGAASIIQGSTEVTGGGRVKELRVKGKTWVNRWPVVNGTSNGVTFTTSEDGLISISGTPTSEAAYLDVEVSSIAAGKAYYLASTGTTNVYCECWNNGEKIGDTIQKGRSGVLVSAGNTYGGNLTVGVSGLTSGTTVNASFRVMLVDGTEAPDCFTPPASIASVQAGKLVTAGKNLLSDEILREIVSASGSRCIAYEDGVITVLRNDGAAWSKLPTVMTVPPGTYVASIAGDNAQIQIGDGIGLMVTTTAGNQEIAFTVNEVTDLNLKFLARDATTYPTTVTDIQLEFGSTATSYEPPTVTKTPLPEVELRSLPNGTCDELVIKADGSCEVERNVTEYEVQGTETINVGEHSNGQKYAVVVNVASSSSSPSSLLSDRYSCGQYGIIDKYAYVPNEKDLVINDSRFTDTDTAKSILASEKPKFVFVANPTTEPQSPVTLPALPAPTFNQYHDADIPTEIEAEVVKVDYLPAPDVYTREEVDKKIEDAGGMPAIVPVSQGGTGVTTAAAERNRLGLGNTTGALPVANGGTGATTAKAAEYNILGGMTTDSSDSEDTSNFAMVRSEPSSSGGVLFKRKGTSVWNWIASKIRSTFGFSSSNVLPVANGGTGGTSAKAAQNSLLNDMNVSSDPLTDSSMLVGYNVSPSASNGAVHKRSMTTVWDYVVGKIRSTFGFNSSNVLDVEHGGTGFNDFPAMLVNLESTSTASLYQYAPRPGVTGTLPVSHGGTGATAPGVDMLSNLGITFGTADPPSTGTPGSIYIQYFE